MSQTASSIYNTMQDSSFWPGFDTKDVHKVHGCCSGPFEVPGQSCTQLPGRLAHSGPLQGVSEPSQGCPSLPHSCSWPQNEHQEECSLPFSTNCVFGSSLVFHSNAGLSGSCLDFQPQYMFGPLQARPSCLREHLSQALRAHGYSLPCAAPGVAPHEAVPLVDEHFWGLLHRTSHSPSKGVAKLRLVREPIYNSGSCFHTLLIWWDPLFLQCGVRMGAIHRRQMVTTDAFLTVWCSVFEGRPACRVWTIEFLSWHINCLELRAVFLALSHFLPSFRGYHVIVRTDNMAVVSHINRQGGSRSRTLNRHAHRLLLWAQDKFLFLRAVHVLGVLSLAADFLSRQKLRSGEGMLNCQTVAQVWDLIGKAEVDLFASQESSQCPLWFSQSSSAPLGIDTFAHSWPDLRLYAFLPIKLIPAVLCKVMESGVHLLLVAPFWPSQM